MKFRRTWIVAASVLAFGCSRHKMSLDSEPVQTLRDLTLSQTEKGKPSWDLYAITAHLLEQDKRAQLDSPKMSLYNGGRVATEITAQSGLVHTDSQDIQLSTDVVVHSIDEGSTLTTSELNYSSSKKKFFTDKDVVVRKPGSVVHGTGMEANKDLTEIRIFHQRSESSGRAAAL